MNVVTKVEPEMWEHQYNALTQLIPKESAMLPLKMGAGKSRVVVDLIQSRGHKRTLIVCPAAVVEHWPAEFKKYGAKPIDVNTIKDLNFEYLAWNASLEVWVISYDRFYREPYKSWIKKHNFDLVVLDESHKIKSPNSKAAKFAHTLTRSVPYRLALTGTPAHDRPIDVYSQYKFLDPDVFGTRFDQYRNRYVEYDEFGPYVPYIGYVKIKGYKNQAEWREKFYELAVDVGNVDLSLPDITFTDMYTELKYEAKRIYKELRKDFIARIRETDTYVVADNVLSQLTKLQQIANGRVIDADGNTVIVSNAKQHLLHDWLEDVPDNEAAVVFCVYQSDLEAVREKCTYLGRPYYEQSGQCNQWAFFQSAYDEPNAVIAVQIKSGSAGISLTRANHAAFYSAGFSRGDYEQAIKRLHRPGQRHHTTITRLIVKGTVDEHVYRVLRGKGDVIEELLGKGVAA